MPFTSTANTELTTTPISILVVEDEAIIALDLKAQLEDYGFNVVGTAESGAKAIMLAKQHRPDLALMDIMLKGGVDGVQVARHFHEELHIPVVFLTSFSDIRTVQGAAATAPYGYLTKPFQIKEVRAAIEVAITKSRMERQLQSSEERFRRAFDDAPLGMAIVSLEGKLLRVNTGLCRLLGADAALLIEHELTDVLSPEQKEKHSHWLAQLQADSHRSVQFETALLGPEGEPRPVACSLSVLHYGADPACRLYQFHDLTQQKLAEQHQQQVAEERLARATLEAAQQAQNEFVARMSHELRTPLNAVIGFAQLLQLQGEKGAAHASSYADHILMAGRHLLALVNDVLELQKIGHGHTPLEMTTVAFDPILKEVEQLLSSEAAQREIQIKHEVEPGLVLHADATRLRQVLINLGVNAIKYNRQHGTLNWIARRGRSGRVQISVQDTGMGMSQDELLRLFQPFERLGREKSSVPGVGLGLVIARRLIEDMQGTLEVQSESGIGTTMTIELAAA